MPSSEVSVKQIPALKEKYINKTINRLTIEDIYAVGQTCWCTCKCSCGNIKDFKLTHVLRNRNKSCGCLSSTEELSKRQKQWIKNNPEKLKHRQKSLNNGVKIILIKLKRNQKKFQSTIKIILNLVNILVKQYLIGIKAILIN